MPARIDISEETLNRWRRLYCIDQWSLAEIAAAASCGKNTVRKYLMGAGVQFDAKPRIARKAKGRDSTRKGYKFTDAERAAVARRMRGHKFNNGRVLSEATKARIGAASKAAWQRKVDAGLHDPSVARRTEHARQKFKRLLSSLLRQAKHKKRSSTAAALGYSRAQLVAHIQAQFTDQMSWDKRSSFSIDHVVPISVFIRNGVTDPAVVSSLANLRPVPPKENRMKSDKYDQRNFSGDLARIVAFNATRVRGAAA